MFVNSEDVRSTDTDPATRSVDGTDDVLVRGVSAGLGTGSGAVRLIKKFDHLDQVTEGDITVNKMTMPDMVPAMKRAGAIITDEGGMTSHASIVSCEMGSDNVELIVPLVTDAEDIERTKRLIEQGISSISTTIDAIRDVQHEVKCVEQSLLFDSVR